MTQDYDKIIKENLEAIFIPLSRKILKIESEIFEELPDSLQKTLEREPDFLKLVKHENASKNFILQIEFQSNYDHEMPARMLEYYGLIHRRYKLPVLQHVFYMGAKKKKMKNVLRHESIEFRYNLTSFQNYSYREFIDSEIPEEMLLAILANFENQNPEDIISGILHNIKNAKIGTLKKEKFVRQLGILSKIRNLKPIVDKLTEIIMAIKFLVEDDIFYKKGLKKGSVETKDEMIISFLELGKLTHKEIADAAKVSLNYVRKLAKTIKK